MSERRATPGWNRFFGERLLRLVVLLPLIAAGAFCLVAFSPIDPIQAYVGADAMRVGPEQRALIAAKWGFDQPPPARFLAWAGNVLRGDLGTSVVFEAPVVEIIAARCKASLALMAGAWLLSGAMGLALGILAGTYAGSLLDKAVRAYAFVLASAPTFWAAILLLAVFSVELGWAPFCCAGPPGVPPEEVTLGESLRHLALPVLTLGLLGIAQVVLHTREKVREVMASDYAVLACAQGASRLRAACRHAVRNGALPAITLQFAHVGELFGGSILAEQVFSYPGLGQATVAAGTRGDVPLLLGIALFAALFVFAGNTIADLLYRLVDPRLRREKASPA